MTGLTELLEELEREWINLGCPVDEIFRPGLSEADVAAALSVVTEHPSEEAIEWFAWHNGQSDSYPPMTAYPFGFDLLPLAAAFDQRASRSELAIELARYEGQWEARSSPDMFWPMTWLPIGDNGVGANLTVDIAADKKTCTVFNVDWEGEDFRQPIASSLAEVVEFCLDALRSGRFTWSGDPRQGWNFDFAASPLEWRRKRIF